MTEQRCMPSWKRFLVFLFVLQKISFVREMYISLAESAYIVIEVVQILVKFTDS